METFTFLHLLLITTGAVSYVCKSLGRACESRRYPYWALVFQRWPEDWDADMSRSCSGTLIHERWVLTHADCYFDLAFRIPLKVKFSSCPSGSCGKIHIIPHDNIRQLRNGSDAIDVMVLKLPEPVHNITLAHLPPSPCRRPGMGAKFWSLGSHPKTYESNRVHLKCVDRNVTACYDKKEASSGMFCANAIGSTSPFLPCPEDIGGPLLRREGSSDVVYGVKAYGSEILDVCAARVRQWINDTVNGP